MKIAVDAMGGDHAPAVVVEGAVLRAREFAWRLSWLDAKKTCGASWPGTILRPDAGVVHASEVVEMDDHVNAGAPKRITR